MHDRENSSQQDITKSQQKAYQGCVGHIDSLINLKTSPGNQDGSLLSDEEYVQRRSKLLKEKSTLEAFLHGAGQRVEQQLKLSEQTFEFASTAQARFTQGDAKIKKEIVGTIASNLILKDKKLRIEARKPFFLLGNALALENTGIAPIEPENTEEPQGRNASSIAVCPQLRGHGDDVRTLMRKAERAAALIYTHFRKEFGMPNKS